MKRLSPRSPRRQTKVTFSLNQRPKSARRIDQKVLDSTSHRLSEPANKFEKIQATMNLNAESGTYAINFFKKNPQLKDESRPEDKIQKYDQILNSKDLDSSERLKILVQKKMLVNLVHGQSSPEYVKSAASIGSYYISIHRIASAIRHLEEAVEFESDVPIPIEDSMKIRMELAEAYLSLSYTKKSELVRNTNKALSVIKPYLDVISEDPKTNYVKSHILGKIAFRKNDFEESMNRYNEAFSFLEDINEGKPTSQTANLYFEIGKVYSKQNLSSTAGKYYQNAYDIFVSLNMLNQASVIEPLLPTGEEVDIFYDSDKNMEAITVQPMQNYPNDESNLSRSSTFKNEDDIKDGTDALKLYLPNSVTSKYGLQVNVQNKSESKDESSDFGKQNKNSENGNVEISYLHLQKNNNGSDTDDDDDEYESDYKNNKKLKVEIDIGSDSKDKEQNENASDSGSYSVSTEKHREQYDYRVEINEEEEENEEEDS